MTDQHSSTVTESAPTPTPWRYLPNRNIVDRRGYFVANVQLGVSSTDFSEMDANAAFIVKAVNAHDALVNVVRDLVAAYDSGNLQMRSPEIGEPESGIPYHEWHEEWLHHARAALSQVRP